MASSMRIINGKVYDPTNNIDGEVKDIMDIDPIVDKYRAFGWHVVEIDGHDMAEVVEKLDWARNSC